MDTTGPLNTSTPFTRPHALQHGLTDQDLRGRRFHRVFTGVYVGHGVKVDVVVRAKGALAVCPDGSYASHFTAAELWDLQPPAQSLTHVSVDAKDEGPRRRGIRAHEIAGEPDVVRRRGVWVSTPTRTFVEMADCVGLVDLVIIGDRAVRLRLVTPQMLADAADAYQGRGARLARRAARLVRAGVDSPMETRLRLLIVLAGLPEPKVNVVLHRADGRWWMRFDLSYPELKLVIEYDGRQHADDTAQWDHDIDRREHLDRLGWRLVVVRSKGIYVCPEQTLQRVRAAMRERGARRLPRRFRDEWRLHFPGRAEPRTSRQNAPSGQ